MPTRGKCWSCGEIAFLTAKVLRNKETGSLHCVMVCDLCKRFYEQREVHKGDDLLQLSESSSWKV